MLSVLRGLSNLIYVLYRSKLVLKRAWSWIARAAKAGHFLVMETFKPLEPSQLVKRELQAVYTEADLSSDVMLRSVLPMLVGELSDGVAIAHIQSTDAPLLYVNEAFERLTGYGRHEVLGKDCRFLQGRDHDQPEVERIEAAIRAGEPIDVTLRNYRKDGVAFWNKLSLRPLAVGSELLYLGILRDVSTIRQTQIALDCAANLDIAMGCLNRQSFILAVEGRFSGHVGQAMIVKLDAIGFHDINTGYGFEVGDALLLETSRRLQDTGASVVARIGANEFAMAFALPGETGAQPALDRICNALSPDFIVPGASIPMRFAIGYALDKAEDNAITLIRNAGIALRAAKSDPLGGPRRFREADYEQARHRSRLTRELQVAAANGEFVYHFQPQIDLSTGAWVGAEALMRWDHPLFGKQPPARFIEAAERTGQLVEFSERGLASVAAFARRINERRHRPLRFSINMSVTEFLHHDMADLLDRVLRQTGADPAWLTLEITESMFLNASPGVVQAFRRLRDIGVGISVDDFGTGYSNLRLLERFPVSEIKIDRSFIGELAATPAKMVIVRAVIDLGRALGLTVVAEGVENEEQRALLLEMGCPVGQGYLFGRPVDSETFAAELAVSSPSEPTS